MTYARREVYPKAPLAMVTVEVQLDYEPRFKSQQNLDAFGTAIRESLPVLELSGVFGGAEEKSRDKGAGPRLRAIRGDRRAIATVTTRSLSLSLSGDAYAGYEESFEPLLASVVRAFDSAVSGSSIRRIGLRYLDEIRVLHPPTNLSDWSEWVAPELVAAAAIFPPGGHSGIRAFYHKSDGDRELVCSWGTFHGATVVDGDQPFSESDRKSSSMFILDVDSARMFPEFELFDSDAILQTVRQLHEPVGDVFQRSITDSARIFFRGSEDNDSAERS